MGYRPSGIRLRAAPPTAAIPIAVEHIGFGEAGDNNSGPFVERLFRGSRKSGNWCAVFVAWCLETAGVITILPDEKRRGARVLIRTVASMGRWIIEPLGRGRYKVHGIPVPGAVITWAPWGWLTWRQHGELIESYNADDDSMITIAGNVGRFPSQVQRRHYPDGSWRKKLYGIAIAGPVRSATPTPGKCPISPEGEEICPDVVTGG